MKWALTRPDLQLYENPQTILIRFPTSLENTANQLAVSIRDGEHPEIGHLDFSSQIRTFGIESLVKEALSLIHNTIFSLQGQDLTPDL